MAKNDENNNHDDEEEEVHLPSARRRRVRGINSRIDEGHLKLRGEDARVFFDQSITDGTLVRSMAGASTLTLNVSDERRVLLKEKLSEERLDLELDGLWFRLRGIDKAGPDLTLTFEDREVSYLRRMKGPKKAYRDKVTRAEFVLSLVREVKEIHIPCFIPELHKIQPIKSVKDVQEQDQPDRKGANPGLDTSANLTVKGVAATPEQLKNGATILGVGARLNAPEDALVACIAAAITENGMTNTNHGGDCMNIFCVTTAALPVVNAAGIDVSDVAGNAEIMYKRGYWHAGLIESVNRGLPPHMAAQEAEGSYASDGRNYAEWVPEAREWVAAFNGGSLGKGVSSTDVTSAKRYAFEVGKDEDYWTAIQRLAEEVRWRAFISAGIFYFVDEKALYRDKPWSVVNDETEGFEEFDFSYVHGRKITSGTMTGRAKSWAAPPGTTIRVSERDYGIAGGRYLTEEISSNLFDNDVDLKVKKPTTPLPEPAPETVTKSTSSGDAGGVGDMGSGTGDMQGVEIKSYEPGDPAWGGTAYFFYQLIDDICTSGGCSIGGRKEGGHQEGGDHDPVSVTSFATDYPTMNGQGVAEAVARALGVSYAPGSWNLDTFEYDGHTWRTQILWAAPDGTHHDHVHVGIRRS